MDCTENAGEEKRNYAPGHGDKGEERRERGTVSSIKRKFFWGTSKGGRTRSQKPKRKKIRGEKKRPGKKKRQLGQKKVTKKHKNWQRCVESIKEHRKTHVSIWSECKRASLRPSRKEGVVGTNVNIRVSNINQITIKERIRLN